jgi:hypothetical protein
VPSLSTLIQDLENRTIQKILFPPDGATRGGLANISVISKGAHIQYDETPILCNFGTKDGGTVLTLQVDASFGRLEANGLLLGLEVDWTTIADVTRVKRLIIGRGYAGCLYTVFDVGGGTFRCAHTSREGGKSPEATADKLLVHARGQRWRVVHQVETRGLIGNDKGCTQVYILTRVDYTINPRPRVQTVRLQIGSSGAIVHSDVYTDA